MSAARFDFARLPIELRRHIVAMMSPEDLFQFEAAGAEPLKRVASFYERVAAEDPVITAAYGSQETRGTKRGPDFQRAADRLATKTQKLFGGRIFVTQATRDGTINTRHPDAQRRLADGRWNCKIIGLYPFLKAINGGAEFFAGLDRNMSGADKFRAMEEWVKERALEVTSVSFAGGVPVPNTPSFFFSLGGKNYNLVPRTVGEFLNLRNLSAVNTYLNDLPGEMGKLPLVELQLSMNHFVKIPDCVGDMQRLRKFSISSNREVLSLPDDSPLWRAAALRELDLSGNQLGVLSNQIGLLTQLEVLDLQGNQLAHLPRVGGSLPRLRVLYVQKNPLHCIHQVGNWILDYTGEGLHIVVDKKWGRSKYLDHLNSQLAERGYTLSSNIQEEVAHLIVQKVLESTQII